MKVAFIGGGKMAEAILKGGLRAGIFTPETVFVSTPGEERREYLRNTYGIQTLFDNPGVVGESEVVILAVKPTVLPEVLEEIKETVKRTNPLLISVAAGITLSYMAGILGEGSRLVRVMPNTPALVLSGVSVLSRGGGASEKDLEIAERIFSALGEVYRLPEELFDAVTGLSGSGPAYVFAFIEALVDGGVLAGLPREVAERLALGTVLGAARLMQETGQDPYTLKAMVTSPGGTTIAGLKALAEGGFYNAVMEAVVRATRRSKELSRG